ncbi:apolipoprotein N-acyltransferase [Altererythrobacter confluentis]|uniref:Apolipoprotein N-acyltransferase n=1 Tax=Allopontixanthobacter confluentis TaxID=1849021 RepID=A0A6L7GK06_9SPHN|nr:apolipoprotein N-acyltransferase [Allopontixanthobacter confluentis]MXP14981.1 apolipoprotein N-acyltransferase [Allopontixanthobacter confluentis]
MERFSGFAQGIKARPRLAAIVLGLAAATGFPPLGLWPVTLLALGGLVWLIRTAPTMRAAAWTGWFFGVAHFTLANNWIATAFTYQAEMPPVLGWLAVPLVSLYLAIYPAMACAAGYHVARRTTFLAGGIGFAGCWIVAEWLRSWVFTGYAWDPIGLALLGAWDRPGIAVLLPWMGTYALSGLAIVLGAGFVFLVQQRRGIAALLLAGLVTAGMVWPAPPAAQGTLNFTLVQPDLRQEELADPSRYEDQFLRLAALSMPRHPVANRLVLWPESGVPDYLRDGYPQRYYDSATAGGDPRFARFRIGRAIGAGSLLLTGATDLAIENGRAVGAYNTITALDSAGQIAGSYSKAHLVPYGEYLALRWLLEPLGASRLVAGTIDFLPGPGPRTLDLGPLGQAGMQICYEIVFSGQVVDPRNRPDYIFNPSNDGWFGSWGPPQHLGQARMRAIEEGLPVLRSTTTGISAVIDANGVVRSYIARHRADRIDGLVPPAKPPTLFARTGNALALGWAFLALVAALAASPVATRLRRR